MAAKGALLLKIDSLIRIYEQVQAYEKTVQDAFYSQYKKAYDLTRSNHFRGEAADAFKAYLSDGALGLISNFLAVSADLTAFIQLFAEAFFRYESSQTGVVGDYAIDEAMQEINAHETAFDREKYELRSVLSEASRFISTRALDLDTVNTSYSSMHKTLAAIRDDLYATDDSCVREANILMERILDLHKLINSVAGAVIGNKGVGSRE
ncbi:MAG: LXG domain-containing protein [Clostridiales bacterium]|nr:LXG domain-containing protein [Clostridiales bacterium]